MKFKNGEKFTVKEMLAMYFCMHLETTPDGNAIDETSSKNEKVFHIATNLVGGREKLDALAERFTKTAATTLADAGYDLSDIEIPH